MFPYHLDLHAFSNQVLTGSPSRNGDAPDINEPSLPALFYSVLVSISVLLALSTAFHSINSSENSPLSHSVLPVSLLSYRSFQL